MEVDMPQATTASVSKLEPSTQGLVTITTQVTNDRLTKAGAKPNVPIKDYAKIVECLTDSIEHQCSRFPPHVITYINRIEEEVQNKASLESKDDLPLVFLSKVQKLVKYLKTEKAPSLDDISNKAIKCFSLPLLRLLVVIFNACLKKLLFSSRLERGRDMSALTRLDVLSEPFLKAPPSLSCCTPRTLRIFHRAFDELGRWFRNWRIKVNSEKPAAIQFKYSKRGSRQIVDLDIPRLKIMNVNIPWQFNYKYLGVTLDKNLHFRDRIKRVRKTTFCSELNSESCLDASKWFLDIAGSHPNALLRTAVAYQPPHPNHFICRSRNIRISDPLDALTEAVESLREVNDTND
ncbi:hypothetical protein EVAR_46805_1 [Eumeta japonica]|uniref:RNA-directed DNA polymerase from mobile element jockey n=1 Tax=Eumeta variegata TaxID=151549 RepID=A0A4C1XD85_EUMVA|nr:hypothetical protein EVAR_46805_1 [Eumeta japonica]